MPNPFLLSSVRSFRKGSERAALRRRKVLVPANPPSTDAIFMVLRRMRMPLIAVIVSFAIAVFGLTFVPGTDADGNLHYLTVFDAFYLMSYTALTIGYGETPYTFSIAQRMWITFCIYLTVVAWAYALGAMFSLLQDHAFRGALATQGFARQVRHIRQPFLIVAGSGQMGRAVASAMDALGRPCVVLDTDARALESLAALQLATEAPSLQADARDPNILGLAGLGSPHCSGVLALTDSDNVNMAIVAAVGLLRDDVPVIARSNHREVEQPMREFGAAAVINPYDRYGAYLLLRLQRPATFQLATWLIAPQGTPLPPRVEGLAEGRWLIAADGRFGSEIERDLREAGLDVALIDPEHGVPDTVGVAGFIAGTGDDYRNLALAAHARLVNPDVFLTVRQHSLRNEALLRAFAPDAVFVAAQLTTQEALARVITPAFWNFVEFVIQQDDAWCAAFIDTLVTRVGRGSPDSSRVEIDAVRAPAVLRRLAKGGEVLLGDLLRNPSDRDHPVAVLPVMLIRGDDTRYVPGEDTALEAGDVLICMGSEDGYDDLSENLFYDHALEYATTGRQVPVTWFFQRLTGRRLANA